MDAALAPHVCHLEVLAPLSPGSFSSPLPHLPRCPRLRRLTLRHIRAEALPALRGLTALQALDATGGRVGKQSKLSCCCSCVWVLWRAPMLLPPPPAYPCILPAVLFPSSDGAWLDWAASLSSLQYLGLAAALLRLQPEAGLASLLPLARRLRALRLEGCMLLTDAGVETLAQLGWVRLLGGVPGF